MSDLEVGGEPIVAGVAANIGSDKRPVIVRVKQFHGAEYLDIRKCFRRKIDGVIMPTNKGVMLNRVHAQKLFNFEHDLWGKLESWLEDSGTTQTKTQVRCTTQSLISRCFHVEWQPGESKVVLDDMMAKKLLEFDRDLIPELLSAFCSALDAGVEDESEREMVLDMLSSKLKRI